MTLVEAAIEFGRFKDSDLLRIVDPGAASKIINKIDNAIRVIGDCPHEGCKYRDFTTLWKDQEAFRNSVMAMFILGHNDLDEKINKVVAIEAKGWVYGAILADRMNLPFVPIRKHGLLPAGTATKEYGHHGEALRIHRDAISSGDRVLLVDDLILTGESTRSAAYCIEALGGKVVKIIALVDMDGKKGKNALKEEGYNVATAITYPDI